MRLVLGEICDFINGGPWSDSEYSDSGIHVVKVSNMVNGTVVARDDDNYLPVTKYEVYKKHELKTGDLIVATVGSHPTQLGSVVGRTSLIPSDYSGSLLNQNAVCLRVRRPDVCNQRFLFYLSNTVLFKHHIESRARGSANQVRMAVGELKKFTANYPTIDCQRKIAALLSTYDEQIENNRRRIRLLEVLAGELYREWFVRLRFPAHQKAKIVKGTPLGWKILKIGDLFDTSSGGTPARQNQTYYDGEICWVKTGELKSTFVLDSEEKITQLGLDNSAARVFPKTTIVIAMYCAMPDISILAVDSATNQACCAFLPKKSYLHYTYSYFLIKFAQKHLINFAHGAAQQNLSQELIKRFPLLIPTEDLIRAYSKFAEPLFAQIEQMMRANSALQKTRDLLLPRLISGKLPIENLDVQFPAGMMAELSQDPNLTPHA